MRRIIFNFYVIIEAYSILLSVSIPSIIYIVTNKICRFSG